jgi:hypothetical protein
MGFGRSGWGLAALFVASCGTSDESGSVLRLPNDGQIAALRIEPDTVNEQVTLGASSTIGFKVFAREQAQAGAKPREIDVTAEAVLTLEGAAVGRIERSALITGEIGGKAKIVASARALTATAPVTLKLTGDVFEGVAPTAKDALAGAADPTSPLAIDYPLAGTVFPANIPPPEVQWTGADLGDDALVRVDLTSPEILDLHLYAQTREIVPSANVWRAIGTTAADASLTIEVHAKGGGRHLASEKRAVVVSSDTVSGAIFAHTPGKLELFDFLRGTETPLPTDNADHQPGKCAGCHNVSHDARRIGFGRPPDLPNAGPSLNALRAPGPGGAFSTTLAAAARSPSTAFNPLEDTTRPAMLATLAKDDGLAALALIDPDNGNVVPSNLAELLATVPAAIGTGSTMPAWSRGGDVVVFAGYATDIFAGPLGGQRMKQASLLDTTVAFDPSSRGFRFGAPRVLATPGPEESFHRPTISVDAVGVAFTNEATVLGVTTRSTEIVRRSDGHRFRIEAGRSDAAAGWVTRSPDWSPDLGSRWTWIVVNSSRPYGHRTGSATPLGLRQQLWIFAVDRARLEAGEIDPSAPGFWIPGQRLDESYARPQWRRIGG